MRLALLDVRQAQVKEGMTIATFRGARRGVTKILPVDLHVERIKYSTIP